MQRVLGVDLGDDAPAVARAGSKVDFQKLRLAWMQTRQRLGGEIAKLKQSILGATKDTQDAADVQAGIPVLDDILENLDERLIDKLDEIYVCEDDGRRARLVTEAKAILNEYATFVATDPLLRAIDTNPFTPVAVASQAGSALKALSTALR